MNDDQHYHEVLFYTLGSKYFVTFRRNGRMRHYGENQEFQNRVFRNPAHIERLLGVLKKHNATFHKYPTPWSGKGPDFKYTLPKITN